MLTEWINIGLGFVEGIALIASPCILPILPILFAGSLTGSKRRPLGIVLGFILIFSLFTFFSRQLVLATGIDLNVVRHVSYAILILLSIIMISSYLTERFNLATQRLVNVGASFKTANNAQGGFVSGVLFGGLIAIIWTPCAGPILAAVIVQTVIQHTTLISFLVLLAFAMGVMLPLLAIILFGRALLNRFSFITQHTEQIRKIMGLIILLSVAYIWISEISGQSLKSVNTESSNAAANQLINGLDNPYPAPEIGGISAWVNSTPVTLDSLHGKVVLIDFWTYSCINCLRTLPYLKTWYAKYHDQGFTIIGVHTPEFDFEKDLSNVKNAVAQYGIAYPVALDNQFATWQNFNNKYWPAHYLINKDGKVVYEHFGEGDYDVTENNIRYLLNLPAVKMASENGAALDEAQTPETYLGFERADHFSSPQTVQRNLTAEYSYPINLATNAWALSGKWQIQGKYIVAMAPNASIKLHFQAAKVFAVMGSENAPIKLIIRTKVGDLSLTVGGSKLYTILENPTQENETIEIISTQSGLRLYTFTFGD